VTRIRVLLARFLPQGAILLAILTFASYAAGLVRDRMFARTFGAGPELDAYNAAFVLPELALDVLVASGLTAPFVPVFAALRREDAAAAARFAQTVLTLAVLVMGVASLILLLLAPATIALIAPGFDEVNRARYLDLFRLMLLTPVIFAASIALGEVLVAERRFLSYALAPILYNVGIAGGTILLHGSLGIRAAAVGAVAGALLHLGIRVAGIWRSSVPLRPRLDLRMPAVREFLRLMVPKMASHPVEPLTFLFFTNIATTLAAGSVTAVSFARNFQSVPVSLFGVAISLAAFPALSAAWAAGDRVGFRRQVRTSATTIGVLAVASAVGLLVVGPLAIEVLLGGGAFDAEDVRLTAAVLAAFALAVPFDALGHLLARGLYATHNTVLPVLASLAGFAVTIGVTLALVAPAGVLAIPFGFAAGTAVRAGLQGLALARRTRGEAPMTRSWAGSAPAAEAAGPVSD
jgi:putative peptidoglycan lipid II flippase